MSDTLYYIICAVLVIGVLVGISMMSKVKTTSKGNLLSALSMAAAIFLTLYKYEILNVYYLWAAMAAGLVCGIYFAGKIKMIEMPQVVALLNGFGGAASALVAAISMQGSSDIGAFGYATGALALVVGCITLTGSLVAAGKLHKVLTQKSVVWKDHQVMITLSVAVTLLTIVLTVLESGSTLPWIILCALASGFFGIAFSVRVGGADMPITISLLNSLSGVAGSIAGMAINDPLLVAIGGVVGASGLLLTQIMCKSMNRSLKDILLGKTSAPAKKVENTTSTAAPSPAVEEKTATQNEDNNSFI
ncbi:NAD(P)(+) transhydrogenase (Re/Si-specific) subunit beta, partial [Tyzzerella sp. OttesenSCG-928-J15]|nr:NAD(P)(+) transhydrogenase (Re/Si-specific) subunit beta [Tyzzerella sp. OttesenSCG-928-J15]